MDNSFKMIYVQKVLLISTLILFSITLHASDIGQSDSTHFKTNDPTIKTETVVTHEFNPGLITSVDQFITGKIAGIQIMTNDGQPFNGSTIRIRGASTVIGTREPLIVLDGIPLSYGINWDDISSQLNMNDIENITVLKDAASTALYGMQGSNGVIAITTKKGNLGKLKFNLNSTTSLQTPGKGTSMMNAAQFRDLINSRGDVQEKALLGTASTDWNSTIYQNAFAASNQLSISGGIGNNIPMRASLGYLKQDGTLKTENYNRYSGSLIISPSFFQDYLKLNISLSGSMNNNRFANKDAILEATEMNPTQPVTSNNAPYAPNFGGYWQSAVSNSMGVSLVNNAPVNPVSTLNLENLTSRDYRYAAKFDIDYKFHFLPDLHFKFMYGLDAFKINESYLIDKKDINLQYFGRGLDGWIKHSKKYETLNLGFNYSKTFNTLHKIDALIAYQQQHYSAGDSSRIADLNGSNPGNNKYTTENNMVSLYGIANYTFADRYTLSLGLRHDSNSRYSSELNAGNFPSASLTYNISNGILKGNAVVNDLRVKFCYGVTGLSQSFSNNALYSSNLTFETTESKDIVIDYGLFNNRISGEIDLYNRNSKNLTKFVYISGTTGNTYGFTNLGNISNKGLELTMNAVPVKTHDICWSVSMNASYQKSFLSGYSDNPLLSNVINGVYQIISDGNAKNMFLVYKQIYGTNGKPVEGLYEDTNHDGYISSNDEISFHSPLPDWIFGFNTQLTYKKWNAGCTFRGNFGNYIYNATNALYGNFAQLTNTGALINVATDYLYTGFKNAQINSSYYIEDASFIKLDNISLTYNVGEITKGVNLKVGAIVQNVLTITKYSGVDPEVPNGVDFGFYPRPRIFSVNINLDF